MESTDDDLALWRRVLAWFLTPCSSICSGSSSSDPYSSHAAHQQASEAKLKRHRENLVRINNNLGSTTREMAEMEKEYEKARDDFREASMDKKRKAQMELLAETMLHWKTLLDNKRDTVMTLTSVRSHHQLNMEALKDAARQHTLVSDLDLIAAEMDDTTDYAAEVQADIKSLKDRLNDARTSKTQQQQDDEENASAPNRIQEAMHLLQVEDMSDTEESEEIGSGGKNSPRGGMILSMIEDLPHVPSTPLKQKTTATAMTTTTAVVDLL